ncbi:mediator of RNA polymerase II transcription subunit 15a-like [Neltuma alba]|uniref:mediator of RNA polymerase II transcription subunit 15a-like n=1 Tax=Neltuma alba TaxID=207710 RepID=UPI0010A38EAE|nr:mediator of RNA polymerase II transcription subunit 15a-like [Prosopis alba]XP_028778510.1 mediator of RNA polymerase II transcription subunit 15a-like [Prosopis alba]
MNTHDWRAQLLPHIRQIKVNEITSKLKMCQSDGDDDESLDVQKFSQSVEQKIYAGAASQEDYLQKISSMMRLIDRTAWRAQLYPDSRQRIVNKITDTLKRHLPWAGEEGLAELRRIAVRFEERIYNTATSQPDYLRKISLKMLTMENRGQNTVANFMSPDFVGNGNGSSDAGSVSGGSSARKAGRVTRGGERNAAVRQCERKRKQPQYLADFVTY